jgi:hypothetical protein
VNTPLTASHPPSKHAAKLATAFSTGSAATSTSTTEETKEAVTTNAVAATMPSATMCH